MRNGKYALITGASRGIGRALAHEFASHGHHVVLVARNLDQLETLAIELKATHGVDAQVCAADLTDADSTAHILEFCKRRELVVSTVINNAGVLSAGRMMDLAGSDVHSLININMRMAVELSLAFLPEMRARREGNIVNISSLASIGPVNGAGLYSASKAFLSHFSDSLSKELVGTGVECHTVVLGPVKTDMIAETHWLHSLASSPDTIAEVIYDGVLAGRRKFSAGMLGASLLFASSLIPARVFGRLVAVR
jgi:uncharacterized protein